MPGVAYPLQPIPPVSGGDDTFFNTIIFILLLGAMSCLFLYFWRNWEDKKDQDDWWNSDDSVDEYNWPSRGGDGMPLPQEIRKETELVSMH